MPIQIFFLIVALITLVSAVMVVTVRRMMHAALWLILSLFGVALFFAMLDSAFFAVVQLIVYIGAIAILVIFAVMLTRRVMDDQGDSDQPQLVGGPGRGRDRLRGDQLCHAVLGPPAGWTRAGARRQFIIRLWDGPGRSTAVFHPV